MPPNQRSSPLSFLWSHFARQGGADDEALLLIQCCSCSECTLYSYSIALFFLLLQCCSCSECTLYSHSTALSFCSSFYFCIFYMASALLYAIALPSNDASLLLAHMRNQRCWHKPSNGLNHAHMYFSPPHCQYMVKIISQPDIHNITIKR